MNKQHQAIYFVSLAGVLTALSIALLLVIPGIPIFPAAPFLRYDAMDVPIIIAGMVLGPWGGLLVLFLGCILQAFALGQDGIIGFAMHFFASGALVLLSAFIYQRRKTTRGMVEGLLAGVLGMSLLMIPLNLLITVHGYGVPLAVVQQMLFPVIVPFNLIKSGVNALLAGVILMAVQPILRRSSAARRLRMNDGHTALNGRRAQTEGKTREG